MSRIVLGLVGYNHFIRGYPLGPELRARLDREPWRHRVDIKDMNWGPVAIVQEFQSSSITYDRIVLIAAVQRGGEFGAIRWRRWIGGELKVMDVQNRMFEAVTGIISLDNLLVIGEQFRIWPREVIVIEVELPNDTIGTIILNELKRHRESSEMTVIGEGSMAPEAHKIVDGIVACARRSADEGVGRLSDLAPLSVDDLDPLADVCHNQLIRDCCLPGPVERKREVP